MALNQYDEVTSQLKEMIVKKLPENRNKISESSKKVGEISLVLSDDSRINHLLNSGEEDLMMRVFSTKEEVENLLVFLNRYTKENHPYILLTSDLEAHFNILREDHVTPGGPSQEPSSSRNPLQSHIPGDLPHVSPRPPEMEEEKMRASAHPKNHDQLPAAPPHASQHPFKNLAASIQPTAFQNPDVTKKLSASTAPLDYGKYSDKINAIKEMMESQNNFDQMEDRVLLDFKDFSTPKEFYTMALNVAYEYITQDQYSHINKYLSMLFVWQSICTKNPHYVNSLIKHPYLKTIQEFSLFKVTSGKREYLLFGDRDSDHAAQTYYASLLFCFELNQYFGISKQKVETLFRIHFNKLQEEKLYRDFLLCRFPQEVLGEEINLFPKASGSHKSIQEILNYYQYLRAAFRLFYTETFERRYSGKELNVFINEFEEVSRAISKLDHEASLLVASYPAATRVLQEQSEFTKRLQKTRSSFDKSRGLNAFFEDFREIASKDLIRPEELQRGGSHGHFEESGMMDHERQEREKQQQRDREKQQRDREDQERRERIEREENEKREREHQERVQRENEEKERRKQMEQQQQIEEEQRRRREMEEQQQREEEEERRREMEHQQQREEEKRRRQIKEQQEREEEERRRQLELQQREEELENIRRAKEQEERQRRKRQESDEKERQARVQMEEQKRAQRNQIYMHCVDILKESESIRMEMAHILRETPRGWEEDFRHAKARLHAVTQEIKNGQNMLIEL